MSVEAMMLADLTAAVYELKDAVERNTEALDRAHKTVPLPNADPSCVKCGHPRSAHVITNDIGDGTCGVLHCACIHYEETGT